MAAALAALLLAALAATLLFASTTLRLSALAALLFAGLLVEAAPFELSADTFPSDLAFQAVDRPVDVSVFDANLDGSEFITSCHGLYLCWGASVS